MVFIKVIQKFGNRKAEEEGLTILDSSLSAEAGSPEKNHPRGAEFLKALINTIPAPIYYKDMEGRYLGCNEIFAKEIIGLPKEEIIGKSFSELCTDLPGALEFHKLDMELFREGKSKPYERKFRCADGEIRDFVITRNTFRAEEGEAAILVGVMQDVTEHKQAKEALLNNVTFLETLLDNIPNPVFQRDRNGVYISCNERFASLMKLPKKELIGTNFQAQQHRFNQKIIEMYHRDNQLLLQQGGNQNYETEIQLQDGIKRDFIFTKTTYNTNSEKVAGIIGVMTDITERKQTEREFKKKTEELSEAKKRLELALEATKMGTWEWDLKSNTQTWDENLFHLVGISQNEFNQTYKDLIELGNKIVPPEDNKKMHEAIQRVLEGKTDIYELEHRIIWPDGSIRYFSVKGRTFRDSEGNLLRMIGTTHDITERKEAEKALRERDEKFRIASEQTGHVIYNTDIPGERIDWA
ncbi:MAG: PAS domain S-box protein, partial [Methanosarcinaceae archaeon]|nr:PAS domain S-box protein [Methanosarcinaceae archaeon]